VKGSAVSTEATDVVTRKNGGMPEWAFLEPYWADVNGKRFLSRFMFFRTPLLSCDITRIHTADNQRDHPHDHSRSFVTWKLLGSYDEWVHYDPSDLSQRRFRRHRWLSAHLMRHNMAHSITRVSPVTVTFAVQGPRRHKSSYWTPDGLRTTGMKVDQEPGPGA
jgi:hypothetical protein